MLLLRAEACIDLLAPGRCVTAPFLTSCRTESSSVSLSSLPHCRRPAPFLTRRRRYHCTDFHSYICNHQIAVGISSQKWLEPFFLTSRNVVGHHIASINRLNSVARAQFSSAFCERLLTVPPRSRAISHLCRRPPSRFPGFPAQEALQAWKGNAQVIPSG